MDVPEMVLVLPSFQVLRTETPGAKTSTSEPKFEKEALASEESVAPTVQALGSEAGEKLAASALLFPAAIPKKTPDATAAAT